MCMIYNNAWCLAKEGEEQKLISPNIVSQKKPLYFSFRCLN